MFNVVLVHPEIPPNTGNIIRLCANTGCTLHLIEPLGFNFADKHMRRAGLDYHEYVHIQKHASWERFLCTARPDMGRTFTLSTRGTASPYQCTFAAEDFFVFGAETSGLPSTIAAAVAPAQRLRLPMRPNQRSLNLSNAVAVTIYEAWRQIGFVT